MVFRVEHPTDHTMHVSTCGLPHGMHRDIPHGVLYARGYSTVHTMENNHHCIYHDVLKFVMVCLMVVSCPTNGL